MNILGISAHFHDSSACLLKDGELIAAAQEERFTRVKHDAAIPKNSVKFCLKQGEISLKDIDCVAYYEDPIKKLERQLWMGLPDIPITFANKLNRLDATRPERDIKDILGIEAPIYFFDHHMSHAASTFYFSGFNDAAILIVDGVGEWDTLSLGKGEGNNLNLMSKVQFPHSIGLLYSTITAYLGFEVNDGEYKVMGLAPYGEEKYLDKLRKLISFSKDDRLELEMSYFDFITSNRMYSDKLETLLEIPPRKKESDLSQEYKDIAKSLQVLLEDLLLEKVNYLHQVTRSENLCLAGGVALNCVANGKILKQGPFKKMFVQPASSDAGSCLGAAALAYRKIIGKRISHGRLKHVFLGPQFSNEDVLKLFQNSDVNFREFETFQGLSDEIGTQLSNGKVIGLFQDRMEFGPRSLGGRSIIADPRGEHVRDKINLLVKKRENFRPFAPAILYESTEDYFDLDHASPFMLETCKIKDTKSFPAITHVDGSCRVQTVSKEENPKLHTIINSFLKQSGCPMVLNTSFNLRGEPVVCTPLEAFLCFVRSDIDILVMQNIMITRECLSPSILKWFKDSKPLLREGVSNAVYTFL